jgi:hypothetical protein
MAFESQGRCCVICTALDLDETAPSGAVFFAPTNYHSEMTQTFAHTLIRFALRTLAGLVLTLTLAVGLYLLFAYHFTYSKGESVGYVQKLSYKGWICKTWEGEQIRALAVIPAIPEKFEFTVRDVAIADQLNASIGKKVVLEYEQHKGLPECFGETQHFVVAVRPAPGE